MIFKSTIDVKEIMQVGSDLMIAGAAWVSTSGEQAREKILEMDGVNNGIAISGLINYLMKNRHGSPFEHGSLTVFVNAPIFVWREWHRHRIGFSYNEESARYHTLEPVFYLPDNTRPMLKVDNWKPGLPKFLTLRDPSFTAVECDINEINFDELCRNLIDDYQRSYDHYLRNLKMGFDPGLARDGLNVGIFSSCWVTCNPRSIMSFLSLRIHDPEAKFVSHPLWEIQMAAEQLEELFAKYWPITHKAFCDNGRVAP